MRAQFLQIVSCAETLACSSDDDGTHRAVGGDAIELRLERADHVARQGIEALAAIEGERRNAAVSIAQDIGLQACFKRSIHGDFLFDRVG